MSVKDVTFLSHHFPNLLFLGTYFMMREFVIKKTITIKKRIRVMIPTIFILYKDKFFFK